ncbi:MAG: hypothetical protein WD689_06170, partial [Gaiellaceae bacterium]
LPRLLQEAAELIVIRLLSESLTFSMMALVLAAWIALTLRPTPLRAGLVLAAMLVWTFTRDSNAYVVVAVGALVLLTLLDARHRPLKVALAAGCVVIYGASFASAEAGKRWLLPTKDIVFRRVLETPEMSGYFADHGHPVVGNWTLEPWLERARSVYAGYLLRNPGYVLTAPFHGRQEALYSTPDNRTALFSPDLSLYNTNEGLGFLRPPREIAKFMFPRDLLTLFALVAGAVLLAAAVAIRAGPLPVWVVPAGLLLTTYPHMLAAWHFSGYEVDRHALQASLLLRLGAFLMILVAIDRLVATERERRRARRNRRGLADHPSAQA